ncbi:GNAT family N-acetyltransferase [Devosia sp.]|uniref:GNAT family N-acetyltransferase n=1 Tax=Devosia sp. TaxID=1871048 RepID=UPI002AFEA232|nr:GNAT family N-acetyltransferase [Devosia sp.]
MIPVLRTARFILRQPQSGDDEPIARYLNDFEVAGNLARVPFPYRLSDARAWLRTRLPNLPVEETCFAIALPEAGMVGHVGFHRGAEGPVIGYWLGRPFWGQGIMTEAVSAAIDWFFEASRAEALYSGVFHFNAASFAIQSKLGFVETGRSHLLCLARDAEVEHIDTQLTRTTWKARDR